MNNATRHTRDFIDSTVALSEAPGDISHNNDMKIEIDNRNYFGNDGNWLTQIIVHDIIPVLYICRYRRYFY